MRVELTLGWDPDNRDAVKRFARDAKVGSRVVLLDPEATCAQMTKLRLMLDELARRVEWHGRRLTRKDWHRMLLATARRTDVVPTADEEALFVLFEKDETPSAEEAGSMMELAFKLAAERGVQLGD